MYSIPRNGMIVNTIVRNLVKSKIKHLHTGKSIYKCLLGFDVNSVGNDLLTTCFLDFGIRDSSSFEAYTIETPIFNF